MTKLRLPFTGIAIGIVISIVGIMASAPPCAFADESCPEGATSTFTGTVALKGGTNYTTTLTSASNTDDRTITLPDADGVLMSSSSVDNVTNKTIDFSLNTGTNYNSGDLGGVTLASPVLSSSIDTVGILSGMDIGSTNTTLEQAIAGDINIEGNTVYRAGGADVPPSQGGTGTSSITNNSAVIGNGSSGVLSVDLSTKGDLLVGKTGGVPEDIAVGASGDKLTADSTDPKGMTWTTPPPGGGLAVIDGWYYNTQQSGWSWNSYDDLNGTFYQIPSSNGFVPTGSPMTVSNGVFTFPEPGMYEVRSNFCIKTSSTSPWPEFGIFASNSGPFSGVWFQIAKDARNVEWMSSQGGYGQDNWCFKTVAFFDVVNTANYVVKFRCICSGMQQFNAATNASQFWFTKIAS